MQWSSITDLYECVQHWIVATKLTSIPSLESEIYRYMTGERPQIIIKSGPDLDLQIKTKRHYQNSSSFYNIPLKDMSFAVIRLEVKSIRIVLYEDKLGHIDLRKVSELHKWEMIRVKYKNYPNKIHCLDYQFTHDKEDSHYVPGYAHHEIVVYSEEELIEVLEIACNLYRP